MSTALLAPCPDCRNYSGRRACDAFERIPDDVWAGANDHSKPIAGDHGVRFAALLRKGSPKGSDEKLVAGR